jgi:hypothetical protein
MRIRDLPLISLFFERMPDLARYSAEPITAVVNDSAVYDEVLAAVRSQPGIYRSVSERFKNQDEEHDFALMRAACADPLSFHSVCMGSPPPDLLLSMLRKREGMRLAMGGSAFTQTLRLLRSTRTRSLSWKCISL